MKKKLQNEEPDGWRQKEGISYFVIQKSLNKLITS